MARPIEHVSLSSSLLAGPCSQLSAIIAKGTISKRHSCMAGAHHSLSPTIRTLLASKQTTSKLSDKTTERDAGGDLEDGEITDDLKPADAEATAKEGAEASVPILSRESCMPSQATRHEPPSRPVSTVVKQPNLLEAHTEQASEPELETASIPTTPDPNTPRALSAEELDLAKNIVLDLLGWGVQPEYLIECGVSSHAIYRIFTDLHLRLPTNLSYFG